MSRANGEPVNDSGLVPGVVLGFMLVTAGWLAAGLVTAVGSRNTRATLGLLVAFAWVIGAPAVLVWAPPDWVYDLAYESRRGLLLIAVFGIIYVPGMTIVGGVLVALAWIADRTPLLRRMNAMEELRRQGVATPSWFDPPRR